MTEPVKQTTYVPTRKIAAAAGIGLPLAVLIAWVLSLYEIKMPVEVAAALGSLLSSVIGYFVPDKQNLK
jgi:Na+/H+ antiporter NhaA